MTELSVKDIFKTYPRDPLSVARAVVGRVEAAVGEDYVPVDPTLPYAVAIECSIASGASIIEHIDSTLQVIYPNTAQNMNDLFRHMSDVDYINAFGQPSINGFYIHFLLEEVQALAVSVNQATESRKLIIPAGTVFGIGSINFTLLYPIVILLRGRSLNVIYDTNEATPLQTLETNLVDWTIVEMESDRYLRLTIPIFQLDLMVKQVKTSAMSVLRESYIYPNSFHACRVFQIADDGTRVPVDITFDDFTFNPNKLTALLRVDGSTLTVYIPPIYFTNGLVGDNLQVEIYSTQGPLASDFDQHSEDNFTITWDKDSITKNEFSAPLTRLTVRRVLSGGLIRSGRVALSFEEMRSRVIDDTLRVVNYPITSAELVNGAEDRGFKLVKSIDTITKRIYQATRRLPAPANSFTVSGIGACIGLVSVTIDRLGELGVIWDNGSRVTISPSTLYNSINSIIQPKHIDFPDTVAGLPGDALVANIMSNDYLYSPFHYVLDTTGDTFETRAYYLAKPVVENGFHVNDNETTGFVVSLTQAGIERTPTGYIIRLYTVSNAAFKELDPTTLYMVMSFTPEGESAQAHVLGEYVTTVMDPESPIEGEFIFQFKIDSNFDITSKDSIMLTSAKMYDTNTLLRLPTNLRTEFDIRLAIKDFDSPTAETSSILADIPYFFLESESTTLMDVVHDRINVKFGDALRGLWAESRTTITERDYIKHPEDVYDVYTETQYKRIAGTNAIETTVVNGQITYTIEHNVGDFKLDSNGNKIIKFLANTNVLDEFGRPIVAEPRKLQCELNLFLMDGAYYFATEEASVSYRDSVVDYLITWLDTDIAYLRGRVMPNTEIFYYPQTTIGRISATLDGENKETIDSEQQFVVRYIVSKSVYDNDKLRVLLEQQTKAIITAVLDSQYVSMSDMVTKLEEDLREQVLGVSVLGLAGKFNATYVSTGDESQRLTIGKRLINRVDGKLAIEDNIEFNWIQHMSQ